MKQTGIRQTGRYDLITQTDMDLNIEQHETEPCNRVKMVKKGTGYDFHFCFGQ